VRMLATPEALGSLARQALQGAAVFGVVSLVAHALELARRARVKEAAELGLQASLARARLARTSAELRGLQMQVNPGFLFTALGAVAARIRSAPDEAERMVVRLADLLRQAMGADGAREVALEDEMRALRPFLEVEEIRLGSGLRVEWRVDDDALDAQVPRAVLQPLVMQAVTRAAADAGGGMRVCIEARRRDGWLELEVRGDGAADAGAGDAETETRARLARLYGDGSTVELAPAGDGGTRAVLRLPWHEEPWPAAAGPALGEEIAVS
jgi:two-component system, LytTR family, sensor kinase